MMWLSFPTFLFDYSPIHSLHLAVMQGTCGGPQAGEDPATEVPQLDGMQG